MKNGVLFVCLERSLYNMKTKFRRSLSMLMAVLLCFSAFMGIGTTTAFAASETDEVALISYPCDGDANLDYSGTWDMKISNI